MRTFCLKAVPPLLLLCALASADPPDDVKSALSEFGWHAEQLRTEAKLNELWEHFKENNTRFRVLQKKRHDLRFAAAIAGIEEKVNRLREWIKAGRPEKKNENTLAPTITHNPRDYSAAYRAILQENYQAGDPSSIVRAIRAVVDKMLENTEMTHGAGLALYDFWESHKNEVTSSGDRLGVAISLAMTGPLIGSGRGRLRLAAKEQSEKVLSVAEPNQLAEAAIAHLLTMKEIDPGRVADFLATSILPKFHGSPSELLRQILHHPAWVTNPYHFSDLISGLGELRKRYPDLEDVKLREGAKAFWEARQKDRPLNADFFTEVNWSGDPEQDLGLDFLSQLHAYLKECGKGIQQ